MIQQINTDPKKIEEILTRGVANVYNKDELREKLLSGKQLHLKFGTDVTGPLLTLGHAVVHRKIRDFQELGHRLTLIIGDYTTLIGDHSDKLDVRKEIETVDIEANKKEYSKQFFRTVLEQNTEIRNNSEWLGKLGFNDVINLAKQFTVSQMLDRETFKLRYEQEKPIKLSEFLYPLMQGYDSVALNCDLEFGGTDQTFNMLAGRQLMGAFDKVPQSCLVMRLLTGNDGRPMGKSLKNYIPIMDSANDMYGKLMSIVDDVMWDYFELITRVPMQEIEEMKKAVLNGANPMEFKKKLAREVVTFYHDSEAALQAEKEFEKVVQNKDYSEAELITVNGTETVLDLLMRLNFASSKSEARRLIDQKAVRLNDKVLSNADETLNEEGIFKAGKRNVVRIKL